MRLVDRLLGGIYGRTAGAVLGRVLRTSVGLLVALGAMAAGAAATADASDGRVTWQAVRELGATFSVYSYGQAPYNRSAPFLGLEARTRFSRGAEAFAAPQAGAPRDANGLTCESCHFRDGRGRTHAAALADSGFSVMAPPAGRRHVFRILRSGNGDADRLTNVRWVVAERIDLSGGERVELVRPIAIVNGAEQPVDLRNAPGTYGLGLLEAIPDAVLANHARARRFARFGVTGRVGVATDATFPTQVGRFGWKASFATLAGQVSNATMIELGVVGQGDDRASLVADLTDYLRFLAVPARRLEPNGAAVRGASRFADVGCAMCHVPSWRTGDLPSVAPTHRSLTIYPFTDLLLHDMGPRLSDPWGGEGASLWRTPALWGIGVQHGVARDAGFLHDGRARTVTEAILWHGGEGQYSVARFRGLSPKDRADLIAFLSSL